MSSPAANPRPAKPKTALLAVAATVMVGLAAFVWWRGQSPATEPTVDLGYPAAASIDPALLPPVDPPAVAQPQAPATPAATPQPTLAAAVSAAPPPGVATTPPPAQTVNATDDCAGLSAHLCELRDLARKAEAASARLDLLQTEQQINQLAGDVQGANAGTNKLPVLVGLTGSKGRYSAEFAVGQRVLTAAPGDWVTAEWKLDKVLSNGVVVRKANGRETHTMLMGGEVSGRPEPARGLQAPPVTR